MSEYRISKYQKGLNKMKPEEYCPDCGGLKEIRNPTGKCDHLYYPDYKKKVKKGMSIREILAFYRCGIAELEVYISRPFDRYSSKEDIETLKEILKYKQEG